MIPRRLWSRLTNQPLGQRPLPTYLQRYAETLPVSGKRNVLSPLDSNQHSRLRRYFLGFDNGGLGIFANYCVKKIFCVF